MAELADALDLGSSGLSVEVQILSRPSCQLIYAGVAQLVELHPSKVDVASSNLVSRFYPEPVEGFAPLAQLAEQDTLNVKVIGSTPMWRILIFVL